MKVTKWVEFSQEVEIEIGADDIRCAVSEAFGRVNARDIDDSPNRYDVSQALNSIGTFLNGLTDEHISLLSPAARQTVAAFLGKHAERFSINDANARLIAAASELLEALKECRKQLDLALGREGYEDKYALPELASFDAIIAKAENRS